MVAGGVVGGLIGRTVADLSAPRSAPWLYQLLPRRGSPSRSPRTQGRTVHDVEGLADDGRHDAVPEEAHGDVRQRAGERDPEVLLGALVVRHLREAAQGPQRDGVAGARVADGGQALWFVMMVGRVRGMVTLDVKRLTEGSMLERGARTQTTPAAGRQASIARNLRTCARSRARRR